MHTEPRLRLSMKSRMKTTARLFALPLTGLALTLPTTTLAAPDSVAETQWYQVSLVIFKHRNSPLGNERWPTPDTLNLAFPKGILELEPAADEVSAVDASASAPAIPFRNSKPADEEFQQALRSIKLSSNYEIMTEASWNQPALDKDQAIPVLVQAGNEYGGYYELEGSITLVVSRYLHMNANLWLSEYIQQVEMIAPWWESSNTVTERFGIDGQQDPAKEDSLSYQEIDFSSQPSYAETVTRYESVRTVVLNESRRMRSGELHYLDNPMFGMLVKVVPYEQMSEDTNPLPDALPQSPISLR